MIGSIVTWSAAPDSVQTSLPSSTTLYAITAPGYDAAVRGNEKSSCGYSLSWLAKPAMTGVAFEIVLDRVSGGAAFQAPSPFCDAVILHVPTLVARKEPRSAFSTTHAPVAS